MPTGRLRAGYDRVAGVATVEAVEELRKLMAEMELPSFSQAVGLALQQWLVIVRGGVTNHGPGDGVLGPGDHRAGVVNPVVGGSKPLGKGEGTDLRQHVQVSPAPNAVSGVPPGLQGRRQTGEEL